jgi:GH25 family lysozyme M1 (1,4-beta-N-acetylmuramidase)
MAVLFGVDVSDFQGDVDAARMRADGVEFAIIKATEGSSWKGQHFAANLQRARAAGQLVAAYHYVRGDVSASAQLANVISVVPLDVPVILDVEANSGDVSMARAIHTALKTHGYRTPLLYLPRWYWQQIGSPDLSGLPPLWSSHYPDNVVGSLAGKWAQIPDSYWAGYGGLNVAVLQFTSSASVGGRSPIDANAYRGTRDELAALLQGGNDMNLTDIITVTNGTDVLGDTTVAKALGRIAYELSKPIVTRATINADPKNADTLLGRAAAADGHSWDNAQRLIALTAKVDGLTAAVAALSTNPDLTADAVKAIVTDAVKQSIQITGTVDIHSTTTAAPPIAPAV